jgi:hypothetical protein
VHPAIEGQGASLILIENSSSPVSTWYRVFFSIETVSVKFIAFNLRFVVFDDFTGLFGVVDYDELQEAFLAHVVELLARQGESREIAPPEVVGNHEENILRESREEIGATRGGCHLSVGMTGGRSSRER